MTDRIELPQAFGLGRVAARLLLDDALEQAGDEGHAARFHRLQIAGREQPRRAPVATVVAAEFARQVGDGADPRQVAAGTDSSQRIVEREQAAAGLDELGQVVNTVARDDDRCGTARIRQPGAADECGAVGVRRQAPPMASAAPSRLERLLSRRDDLEDLLDVEDTAAPGAAAGVLQRRPQPGVVWQARIGCKVGARLASLENLRTGFRADVDTALADEVDRAVQRRAVDDDLDEVTVAQLADRPACERFGRDMADARAGRDAAETRVGEQARRACRTAGT